MAIRFKRQTSSYNPKDHKILEGVKDFTYSLDSAAVKAKNSTTALTNTIVSGAKQFAADPIGRTKKDVTNMVTFNVGNIGNVQSEYEKTKNQFNLGQISQDDFSKQQKVYDIYTETQGKNALIKANLLKNDEEYQQYVNNRDIKMFSPKRVAMALTREVSSDLMNPYQLAVDYFGGKLGSIAVKGLSRYGKWAKIGGELSVSAGVAGTANVVESYSYGKRAPKELVTDFALGAAFGFGLSAGTKGLKSLRTKALSKASAAVDNAVDARLGERFDGWNLSPEQTSDIVSRQIDDTANFLNETPIGREFNRANAERFTDLQTQNAVANQVQYGAITDNILDGRFPADEEISKVLGVSYEPHDSYTAAKGIVNSNPEAISRLNTWLNETPDNLKMLSDLPDTEIAKIAPGIDGKTIREVQTLKNQVLSDFDNIDVQFQNAGIENYDFMKFLDDEYNFSTSDRVINIDQLGNLKTMKEPKKVQDIFNSNAYNKDSIFPDKDGLEFNTLQSDLSDEVISQRMTDRINSQNENIAIVESSFKATNPDKLTSEEMAKWGQKIDNLTPEDKSLFKKFIDNNCLLGG